MSEKDLIDEALSGLDLNGENPKSKKEGITLTLWVDHAYKKKFQDLQDKTNKDFGKRLQKIVKLAIDRASGF